MSGDPVVTCGADSRLWPVRSYGESGVVFLMRSTRFPVRGVELYDELQVTAIGPILSTRCVRRKGPTGPHWTTDPRGRSRSR